MPEHVEENSLRPPEVVAQRVIRRLSPGGKEHREARLGKPALPWYDIYAPMGRREQHLSFGEARAFVLENFERFSPELSAFARRAFDQGWIDAESRDGKTGGAFCAGIAAIEESRVMCNFDGSLDQTFTIAHELGHAFHNYCMTGKKVLLRATPMTLAETASIFCVLSWSATKRVWLATSRPS